MRDSEQSQDSSTNTHESNTPRPNGANRRYCTKYHQISCRIFFSNVNQQGPDAASVRLALLSEPPRVDILVSVLSVTCPMR